MSDELTERGVEGLIEILYGGPDSQNIREAWAAAVLASDWYAERIAEARREGAAEALTAFGNRVATPKHDGQDGPTLHEVWQDAMTSAADALRGDA